MLRLFIATALLSSLTIAQETDALARFLAPIQQHPAVVASRALLAAAEANYQAVYTPIGFSLQGAYTRLNLSDDVMLPPGLELPQNLVNVEFGLNLRPFPFGDIADLAQQRRVALERAQLSYQQTLANLEVQALQLAMQLRLLEASLEVARAAERLSEAALAATRTRLARGAASETELAEAEQRVQEARQGALEAADNLALARLSLQQLVGDEMLTAVPLLEPVTGALPDVRQAEYDVQLAEVGVTNSQRALYPVAQASYAIPLSDERSELAFALESRTLQPSIRYSYSNPRQSFGGFSPPPGVDSSILRGAFTIGVSLEISAESFAAAEEAFLQLQAAQAGLQAARDNAGLTARSLSAAITSSRLGLEIAERSVQRASQGLADTQQRQALGLATELDVLQAELSLRQAELGLRSGELEYLSSILSTYSSYALPLSEVLP
jgi:outer membrane protein TolC